MAATRPNNNKRPSTTDTNNGIDADAVQLPSRQDPSKYPRKRVSVACEVCRLRKTRCDAAKPRCYFCSNAGIECDYRDSGPSFTAERPDDSSNLSQIPRQDIASVLARVEALLQARTATSTSENPLVPTTSSWDFCQDVTAPDKQQASTQLSPSTHYLESPLSCSSLTGQPLEIPCLVGLSLFGFAKTASKPCPPQLEPLLFDNGEDYLECEHQYNQLIFDPTVSIAINDVDLSFKSCWKNLQSFTKNVLPWIPIFDQQVCAKLVQETIANGFKRYKPVTSLILFIFAIGALTRAGDESAQTSLSETSGLDYFRIASRELDIISSDGDTVTISQCFVLKGCYLLLCLRTLAAFDAIHVASTITARQMARKKWLEQKPGVLEACHRVYWVCYIMEHELRVVIHYGTELHQYDHLALPLSNSHEPGFFWLLSEIALRQIYMNGLCQVGRTARAVYAPRVARELVSQLEQWYEHLHPTVKFPLGPEPILDTQKAFLQAQYYAARFQVNWSYVVQLLSITDLDKNPNEEIVMLEGVQRAIEYAILVINSAHSLCQDRHLMLFTNLICVFALSMMVLCIIDVPEFANLHDMNTTVAAINQARSVLSYWADLDSTMFVNLSRLDSLMRMKGVAITSL
ncbi:hypothetical protein V1524DRAFT_460469 [Lipomyces starkeyi]